MFCLAAFPVQHAPRGKGAKISHFLHQSIPAVRPGGSRAHPTPTPRHAPCRGLSPSVPFVFPSLLTPRFFPKRRPSSMKSQSPSCTPFTNGFSSSSLFGDSFFADTAALWAASPLCLQDGCWVWGPAHPCSSHFLHSSCSYWASNYSRVRTSLLLTTERCRAAQNQKVKCQPVGNSPPAHWALAPEKVGIRPQEGDNSPEQIGNLVPKSWKFTPGFAPKRGDPDDSIDL